MGPQVSETFKKKLTFEGEMKYNAPCVCAQIVFVCELRLSIGSR